MYIDIPWVVLLSGLVTIVQGKRYHLQKQWWSWCLWSILLGGGTTQDTLVPRTSTSKHLKRTSFPLTKLLRRLSSLRASHQVFVQHLQNMEESEGGNLFFLTWRIYIYSHYSWRSIFHLPFLPQSWKWKMGAWKMTESSPRGPFSTSMVMGGRVRCP